MPKHAAALILLLAAAPARAADLPPAPGAAAPVEQRFYLAAMPAEADDALARLAARIDCVAFHRARIEARLEDGLLAQGWNAEADRLWRLEEALARFEAAHIRPLIDAETQAAVLEAFAPQVEDAETRAHRCLAFGDRFALRRVLG